jgi:glycosyltransferase involved in cell wall biosynthesis
MKTLMFGWEFPPHISGGLGTACHGLTEALVRKDVSVLFVIPTLKGGEEFKNGELIAASEVIMPLPHGMDNPIAPCNLARPLASHPNEISEVMVKSGVGVHSQAVIEKVSVAARLTPYEISLHEFEYVDIKQWNYTFNEEYTISKIYPAQLDEGTNDQPPARKKKGYTYSFSGSYGPKLIEEVERYGVVARTITEENVFDIIHAHDWMTFPAGMEAKKTSGKPLVLHIHATEFDRAGNNGNPKVYEIEREGMNFADRLIAVSQRTKDIAISQYQIPEEKIEVVHNGISPVEQKASDFSLPLGSHVISFLGRITYQKGPLYFVEAARKVLEKFPNAHFVVAGSGDLLPLMIERVAQLRISSNFHFTGFIRGEHVDKIWSISDVYVMPSVSEPFGITPLEAIQAGVPVIISNQAGVSEVMPHAIKVDFWKTDALADAICSILKYGSLSGTLRKNSNEEIKNITWLNAAKKIKNLYHELIN